MNLLSIILISVSVGMDAFAVSISSGVTIRDFKMNHALQIGLAFGGFQALMPLIGWLAGHTLRAFISNYDHWIAFGLLAVIGSKMVYESFTIETTEKKSFDPLKFYTLLFLAIATSIDALAVGVSFAFLDINFIGPIIMMGCITFVMSFVGTYIGDTIGHLFENKIELVGGLILIGIGIKILVQNYI